MGIPPLEPVFTAKSERQKTIRAGAAPAPVHNRFSLPGPRNAPRGSPPRRWYLSIPGCGNHDAETVVRPICPVGSHDLQSDRLKLISRHFAGPIVLHNLVAGFWPSVRERSPAVSTALIWTKTSCPPSSLMKPKPFLRIEPLYRAGAHNEAPDAIQSTTVRSASRHPNGKPHSATAPQRRLRISGMSSPCCLAAH